MGGRRDVCGAARLVGASPRAAEAADQALAPVLSPWTAMKEGLLGATLSVSSRSEREEARSHVARWTGSESPEDRRVRALRACRGRRGVRVTAGCRRPAGAGAPRRTPRAAGAGSDRVDDRRAVRA